MEENNIDIDIKVEANVVKTSKKALVALICGIVGICGCFPSGIVGIVFGILGLKEAKENNTEDGRGMSIAGIVCGSLGVIWQVVGIILYIVFVIAIAGSFTANPDLFM